MTDNSASPTLPLATAVRRDRVVIIAALAGVTGLAWLYLRALAADMAAMPGADMPDMPDMVMATAPVPWTATAVMLTLVMWWVMMAGMMLPSAAPMILTFATVNRRKRERGQPFVPTTAFVGGYLIAWGAFSVIATLAQWGLQDAALLSATAAATSPRLAGTLFLAAGLYQLTPLKYACLKQCRSPFDLVINGWRDGVAGALGMGVAHGLYCLGCCCVLMALLFAEGVMNLVWVAAIAAFVLIEKLFPAGQWLARLGGILMLAFGTYLLIGP
jgi:predicted metal-binding membrane protein